MPKKRAKLNKEERKILEDYFAKLSSRIALQGAVLFGSHAYGRPTKHSDIDLVILSDDFKKMNFMKRLVFLSLMRKGVAEDIALDVVGYTPHEFANCGNESAILYKAMKSGIRLKTACPLKE